MSIRFPLVALAALALAAPAAAQTAPAPAAPPAPPAAPVEAPPSPEMMAAVARIEAAGEALDAVMADLEPRAAAVRADAALSDADKETRIRAMIAGHQPVLDAFGAALGDLIRLRTLAEGGSAADATAAAGMMDSIMMDSLIQALVTGEDPDGDEAEDHEDHEGD